MIISSGSSLNGFLNQWSSPTPHDANVSIGRSVGGGSFGNEPRSASRLNGFLNQWSTTPHDPDGVVGRSVSGGSFDSTASRVNDVVRDVLGRLSPAAGASSGASYSSVRPVENSGATLDYKYADLAKHYGMDAKAAYSEALQNTAYERAVADLKRAGLNPVLAAGGLSPAGSFAAGNTLSGGSGSGSSGGYRGSGTGKYALNSNAYNLLGVAAQIVGAVVGSKTTPGSPMLGASSGAMLMKQVVQGVAQGVGDIINMIN